jgi:translation elongation factor EF-Ts
MTERIQHYKKLVPEVREKTGASYMRCLKGLAACDGNIEKAVEWVKENRDFFDYV